MSSKCSKEQEENSNSPERRGADVAEDSAGALCEEGRRRQGHAIGLSRFSAAGSTGAGGGYMLGRQVRRSVCCASDCWVVGGSTGEAPHWARLNPVSSRSCFTTNRPGPCTSNVSWTSA
jgi:hypothetical protein